MTGGWLITGGCGFIGTSLIARLTEAAGHCIRVVDDCSVGTPQDLARVANFSQTPRKNLGATIPRGVELVRGDIRDPELALAVAKGAEVIVHLAANTGVGPSVENPRLDCETNVIGTLNYLEAGRAAGTRRFLFASSGAPVGECTPPIHEELPPHPVSPYGASKLAGEGYCSAYFRSFGLETVCLRFGNVYGPLSGHKNSVVARFIRRALEGKPLEIYGDGNQTRDFLYIADLVEAVLAAEHSPGAAGETFQIATHRETSVRELTDTLVAVLAENGVAVPEVFQSAPRVGDVLRNFSDTAKARRLLGWEPKTELGSGLRATIAWFLAGVEGKG